MRANRLTTFDRLNKDYPGKISPGVIAKREQGEGAYSEI